MFFTSISGIKLPDNPNLINNKYVIHVDIVTSDFNNPLLLEIVSEVEDD